MGSRHPTSVRLMTRRRAPPSLRTAVGHSVGVVIRPHASRAPQVPLRKERWWKMSGHTVARSLMLVPMSALELRGAGRESWRVDALPDVTWPTEVMMPADVTVAVREDPALLTLTSRSSNASAQLIVDLRTWEQVSDVRGDLAERGMLAVRLETLAADRARHEWQRGTPVQQVPLMVPNDIRTWSAMQVLAAATASRWSLPESLGGTPEELRRVNGAFLTVVWGL